MLPWCARKGVHILANDDGYECIQEFNKIVEVASKLLTVCKLVVDLNGNDARNLEIKTVLYILIQDYATEIKCIAKNKIK